MSQIAALASTPLCLLAATDHLWRLLTLRDYNTRVVIAGTMLLGIAAGLIGVYLLLRKRALLGDAISHATLPGVAIAFMWTALLGQDKSLGILLVGAAVSGTLGGLTVLGLRHIANVREDAALGIVLSVFFGAGVALVSVVQQLPGGNIAGLEGFIYGKVVAMTESDVVLAGGALLAVLAMILLFGKEMQLLCFDTAYANSQGWPVILLDAMLIGLVVAITIFGLQAIGLIMVIALLVVPPSSARFWTHDLRRMLLISGVIGGSSCVIGAMCSAVFADLPSGATIVLVGCSMFLISFLFGTQKGFVWQIVRHKQLVQQQDYHHVLRICFEHSEAVSGKVPPQPQGSTSELSIQRIAAQRPWSVLRVRRLVSDLAARGLVVCRSNDSVVLTPRGEAAAVQAVREHRLLELFMMEEMQADVGQADREADYLEHGLLPEHLSHLGQSLPDLALPPVPPNPHSALLTDSTAGNEVTGDASHRPPQS